MPSGSEMDFFFKFIYHHRIAGMFAHDFSAVAEKRKSSVSTEHDPVIAGFADFGSKLAVIDLFLFIEFTGFPGHCHKKSAGSSRNKLEFGKFFSCRQSETGKIIIAGDATARGSFLNDLAANITTMAFDYLDAAPVVVGSRNWITPCHELEEAFFPQPQWFIDAYHEKIAPIGGYTPVCNMTDAEMVRRAKAGV